MTTSERAEDPRALVRRFAGLDEFNTAANAARLTPVGLVLPHLEIGSPPVGAELSLDWRLEDGTLLMAGRAELVEVTGPRATLRMIEVDPSCRVARLFAGEIERLPKPRPVAEPDDTVARLVERTYRGSGPSARPPAPELEVFLPPDPRPAAALPVPLPVAAATLPPPRPTPQAIPEPTPVAAPFERRQAPSRRLWQAAIVLLTATGLGFGARFSFARLEPILADMLADSPAVEGNSLDVPPAGVQPSTLPTPVVAPPELVAEPVTAGDSSDAATEPERTAEVSTRPLDRLRSIRWNREGNATVVTLWGNGIAYQERLLHTRLDAPQPRELLKVRGVDLPFRQAAMEVGTPELNRIRVGFHPRAVANELHIVLDLPSHDVALTGVEVDGQTYRLTLTRQR